MVNVTESAVLTYRQWRPCPLRIKFGSHSSFLSLTYVVIIVQFENNTLQFENINKAGTEVSKEGAVFKEQFEKSGILELIKLCIVLEQRGKRELDP